MVAPSEVLPLTKKLTASGDDLSDIVATIKSTLGLVGDLVLTMAVPEGVEPVPLTSIDDLPSKAKVQVWPASRFMAVASPQDGFGADDEQLEEAILAELDEDDAMLAELMEENGGLLNAQPSGMPSPPPSLLAYEKAVELPSYEQAAPSTPAPAPVPPAPPRTILLMVAPNELVPLSKKLKAVGVDLPAIMKQVQGALGLSGELCLSMAVPSGFDPEPIKTLVRAFRRTYATHNCMGG